MRGAAIAMSLVIAAASGGPRARAEVIDMPAQPAPDPDRGNFWRELLWPHKDEVDAILIKVNQAIANADGALYADYDPAGTERLRFFREIYGPLRWARTLAPDNLEVLRLLGQVADEHGRTREALDALHAALALAGPEKAGVDVTGRLGTIYLRLGKLDEAIRYLRLAQGPIMPGKPLTAHVLVHLAHALAARGLMSDAIDVLAAQVQPNAQYYAHELTMVTFALAVQYDRDDQRGAAFEILERMQTNTQGQLLSGGMFALASMRFAPAADRHYYYGLLYEVTGNLFEARAEFALYAASGDLPFRRRALEHVAEIDRLRRNPAIEAAPQGGPAPGTIRIKHPRRPPP